jgi:hypothetical protein
LFQLFDIFTHSRCAPFYFSSIGMNSSRKRQRRQAAALVVQSFITMGKKSTAQPRPSINIPPKGIGPIDEPNENDVLCGRGGRINSHEGNIRFRDIIQQNKKEYLDPRTKKLEKAHIAKRIVDEIRTKNPPGRFLKEDSSDGYFWDIGDQKAIKKVGQCLREDAPGIRNEIEHPHSSEEEEGDATPKRTGKVAAAPAPSQAPVPPAPVHDSTRNYNAYAAQASATHQNHPWLHRQHSAPMPFHDPHGHRTASFSEQQQQYNGSNATLYNVPAAFYNGVRSTGNQFAKMSQTATEAIRHAAPSGMPANQVAFGRVFTPTVLSSGSTMSTISGLSGLSGAEHGASGTKSKGGSGSLRVSQLSDMTSSMMSLGSSFGLTRSNSLPELGLSKVFTSLSDASFAVLMEEEQVLPPEEWAQPSNMLDSQLRDSSGTSGSSGNRPPAVPGVPPPPRNRTTSAVSAMSWASAGSQRSNLSSSARSSAGSETSWLNPIRSRLSGSVRSDHSFCSSTRSVVSDMSTELNALDLAFPI